MKKHLHIVMRMVRVGVAAGMLNVGSDLVDAARGRGPVDWTRSLLTLAVLVVSFGLGGLLYGVIISRVTRDAVPPTAGVQAMAGMAAGAAMGALFGVLVASAAPRDGALMGAVFVVAGALTGVMCALLARSHRRSAPPSSSS